MRLHANHRPMPGLYHVTWVADSKKTKAQPLEDRFLTPHGSEIIASDEFETFLERSCPSADRLILSSHDQRQKSEYLSMDPTTTHLLQNRRIYDITVPELQIKHNKGHITNLPEIQETLAPHLEAWTKDLNPTEIEQTQQPKDPKGIDITFPKGMAHYNKQTAIQTLTQVSLKDLQAEQQGFIFPMEQ